MQGTKLSTNNEPAWTVMQTVGFFPNFGVRQTLNEQCTML